MKTTKREAVQAPAQAIEWTTEALDKLTDCRVIVKRENDHEYSVEYDLNRYDAQETSEMSIDSRDGDLADELVKELRRVAALYRSLANIAERAAAKARKAVRV